MRRYALRKILLALLAAACCSQLAAQSVPPAALAVFVVSGGNQISEYTTSGVLVRTLTGGSLGVFRGLAFGADGYLYVTNTFTCSGGNGNCNELERFDPNTGVYLGAVGSITPNTNPYSGVTNQAVSLSGLVLGPGNDLYTLTNQLGLYKIDPAANTTVPIPTADCCTLSAAFLPDGTPLSVSSSQNSVTNDLSGAVFNTGSFTSAQSIAFGPDGRLYVLQSQEIDTVPSTGGAITQLSAPGALSAAYFMAFDSQGHIWATDLNYGVREFDSVTGQQIGGFASNKASAFAGIAIGPVFGNAWAWGDNGFGELGNGTTTASPSPAVVSSLSNVVAIADGCCDDEFALALKSEGTVWAWGANGFGELGNGTTVPSSAPVQVSGLAGVTTIAANWDHALAVKTDGTVWAWGYNGNGELGNNTQSNSSVPVLASNLSNVIAVAAGDGESMALKSDGTVWVWGYNGNGQLGIGTTSSAPVTTPVQVSGLSGVLAIAAGNGNSLILKGDGTVWGWGYNLDGRLGNGTTTSSTTPVQASGLSGVIAIAAGDGVSLALKSDGSVWAWGAGPLGNGTTAGSTIPLQVQSLSGMTAVAAGSNYSLALKSDGTVWGWGNNGSGQLGIGTTSPLTPVTTPAQVNNLSGVTAIAVGDIFSLAIEGQANGVATHFSLSATASATAGTSFNFSLTALDASNHQVAGYMGTVHFTSTDPLAALPVDYTFTAADNGTHTFGATLDTAGSQTIAGTDTVNAAIAGVSGPVTVSTAAASHFLVTAPPSVTGGTPFIVTVTALDPFGNTSTSYSGTVHFTSTDALAVLPADYTFTAGDQGTHVFSATLGTGGSQKITATDTSNATITGTSNSIAVVGLATHFAVSAPASATAGTAFSITVTALNAANQTSTSYTGTVVFTSTDPQAVLPPTYMFNAADNGTHVFSAVTLNTTGSQTINATDTVNAAITGTSAPISVTSAVPPPVQITDNENVTVSDTESLPDVFDAEAVHVADAVLVTPLIAVTAPVAEFSPGGLGFGGQSGTQTLTVSDIGQGTLTLASATISGGAQFSIGQISCSSGATSFSTQLLAGGVCSVTINYAASATPANDTALLVFNDNAALSNLPSTPSGASYTQSVPLTGAGTNIGPPPPPPAVLSIVDSETIQVTDTESYLNVFDSEAITVSDQVTVTVVSSPTTTSISAAGVTYGTAATATVSVSSLRGTVPGNVTLSVDGGAPSPMSLSNGSAVFNLGILKAGSHSLSANFATQGSFSGSSALATLVVNQATPTISWANPAPITYGTALSSTQLNATASVPGSFVYSPAAGAVLAGGIQALSVVFTPTDATDYTTATASVTLIVDAPPVFTSANATTFTVGTASSFTVTAMGIPAPVLSESARALPTGVVFDPVAGVLSGTPAPGTGGTYSINFAAVNSVGTALQTFALTVNEAPTITSNNTVTFVVGIARTFTPTATGFPAPTLAESGALPQGLSFAFNALSGTSVEGTEGSYNITFTASNGIGSPATQNMTLVVIPQSLPAFTSPNSATFGDSCPFNSSTCVNKLHNSFTVTTTGIPTPALTAAALPPGVHFTDNHDGTATLSGSPAIGVYHLTFTATGAGHAAFAATQSFTLIVTPLQTLPAFTSATQAAFAVGQANTFTVAAAPFIDKITMASAPSWLVLTDNHDGTATLSGIPPAAPGQVYNITFTASNSGDPQYRAMQTFSLVLLP